MKLKNVSLVSFDVLKLLLSDNRKKTASLLETKTKTEMELTDK